MNGNGSANLKYINANLYSLKSLTVDTRNLIPIAGPAVWSSIIALTRKSNAPLQNLSLQLCENATLQMQFIDELLTAHADTLTTLRLTNCALPSECLEKICKKCVNLEKLQIAIPGKVPDIVSHMQLTKFLLLIDRMCYVRSFHSPVRSHPRNLYAHSSKRQNITDRLIPNYGLTIEKCVL